MRFTAVLFVVFSVAICSFSSAQRISNKHQPGLRGGTDRPTIAIVAHPVDEKTNTTVQYIAASYVKWIEAAGARVVPIPYDANASYMDYIISSTNGMLFPGGGADVSVAIKRAFQKIVEINEQGDYYPIWGTCLGFEWLVQLAGGELQSGFDSENISLPLHFVAPSRVFDADMKAIAESNTTMNNHEYGISPSSFRSSENLTAFFSLISTSTDRNGREFVSMVEGINQPIYGSQFHPEKIFEWGEQDNGQFYEAINHDADAVSLMSRLAQFFVNEARKNSHMFPNVQAERSALIYNYPVIHTGPGTAIKSSFVQLYFFTHF